MALGGLARLDAAGVETLEKLCRTEAPPAPTRASWPRLFLALWARSGRGRDLSVAISLSSLGVGGVSHGQSTRGDARYNSHVASWERDTHLGALCSLR